MSLPGPPSPACPVTYFEGDFRPGNVSIEVWFTEETQLLHLEGGFPWYAFVTRNGVLCDFYGFCMQRL